MYFLSDPDQTGDPACSGDFGAELHRELKKQGNFFPVKESRCSPKPSCIGLAVCEGVKLACVYQGAGGRSFQVLCFIPTCGICCASGTRLAIKPLSCPSSLRALRSPSDIPALPCGAAAGGGWSRALPRCSARSAWPPQSVPSPRKSSRRCC